MSKVNSGWVRKQTAVLLSATLALSPVMAVPAFATETGDDAPLEQTQGTGNADTEQSAEKDESTATDAVEQTQGEQVGDDVTPLAEPLPTSTGTDEDPAPQAEGAILYDGEAYETLAKAFEAAKGGGTITLSDDVYVTGQSDADAIELAGDVTLDLGGHTVYGANNNIAIRVKNSSGGSLTIVNGSIVAQAGTYCTVSAADAELTLEGVTLQNETQYGMSVKSFDGGHIVLRNCQSTSKKGSGAITAAGGTVDVYGGSYTQEGYYDHNSSLLAPSNGTGVINVYGGSFTAEGSGIYVFSSGGTINFYDGNLTVTGSYPAVRGDIDSASYPTASGSINIYGGSVTGSFEKINNGVDVKVSGGTFTSDTVKSYLAPGFTYDSESDMVSKDEDAVVTVSNADGSLVGAYKSLQDAVNAVPDGGIVTLTENTAGNGVKVDEGTNFTLDLAGYKLTNTDEQHTVTVADGGTLTVTDSSTNKTGVIDNVSHGKGALVNYGTVIVEGGTFTRSAEASTSPTNSGGNSWYVIDNQGTLTFNGGNVVNDSKFSSLIRNLNGTLTINDGTFENGFIALKNDDGGTLNVAGGTVTSDEQSIQSWSTTNITGGTLNGRVTAWDYAGSPNESVLTISGGTINGDVQSINYMNSDKAPEVIITGGTITGKVQKATHDGSTGTKPADPTADTSVITISGGKFETAPDEELIVPGSGLTQNSDGSFGIHEHVGTAVAAKDPTCTEVGNKAYWECSECHELFLDEDMTQPTTREDVTIAATGHQNVEHVEAKEATETEAGNLEYWHCADCDRYFSDAALSQETTLADLTIPAKGQEPTETPKDEEVEKDDGLAQTGDATAVAPLVASAVAGASALAAGAVTLRRRK